MGEIDDCGSRRGRHRTASGHPGIFPKDCSPLQIVGQRPQAQRAVLKFATYTKVEYQANKWTPGTLTNQNTKK